MKKIMIILMFVVASLYGGLQEDFNKLKKERSVVKQEIIKLKDVSRNDLQDKQYGDYKAKYVSLTSNMKSVFAKMPKNLSRDYDKLLRDAMAKMGSAEGEIRRSKMAVEKCKKKIAEQEERLKTRGKVYRRKGVREGTTTGWVVYTGKKPKGKQYEFSSKNPKIVEIINKEKKVLSEKLKLVKKATREFVKAKKLVKKIKNARDRELKSLWA